MRRILLVLACLLPVQLFAASGQPVIDGFLEPNGYVQITSLATSVGLGTVPGLTKLVLIQCEAQNVRWRDDGTDPTTTVGMILEVGQTLVYNGNPQEIEFIEVTAGAILNVTYLK
jgi:hypothetical protein